MRTAALVLALLAAWAPGLARAEETPTAITHDGVLAFSLRPSDGTVVVRDLLNGEEAARVPVCGQPTEGTLSDDEVSFVVTCADPGRTFWINTASFEVAMKEPAPAPSAPASMGDAKNEVIVLGMIHGRFKQNPTYTLDDLERLIRAIDPDYVLAEIPPNRLDAAKKGFAETGAVTEPRLQVFPEYTDVLFPLSRDMDFEIIGVAAWNAYMNKYRTAQRRRLRNDPAWAHAWSEYEEARAEFARALRGRRFNPRFIHSAEYDEITRRAFEPDVAFFNDAFGPGGWKNINQAHLRLIGRALDAHRGEGKRFLITFGASHKYWFLDELRKRDDIVIAESESIIVRVLGE